jgi:hypothetical protein
MKWQWVRERSKKSPKSMRNEVSGRLEESAAREVTVNVMSFELRVSRKSTGRSRIRHAMRISGSTSSQIRTLSKPHATTECRRCGSAKDLEHHATTLENSSLGQLSTTQRV